eukprot:5566062-Prymnesium_polylepis.2
MNRSEVEELYFHGKRNHLPVVVEGQNLLAIEDACTHLQVNVSDADLASGKSSTPLTVQVDDNRSVVYIDSACSSPAQPDTPYAALYFMASEHFNGPFGDFVMRAYDGEELGVAVTVSVHVDARPDAPVMNSLYTEVDASASKRITFTGYDIDLDSAASAFRVQVLGVPSHGQLYDGDPSTCGCPPLAPNAVSSGNSLWYKSASDAVSEARIALNDTFLFKSVTASPIEAYSSHTATATIGQISNLVVVESTAVGVEDQLFDIVLQTRFVGAANEVGFDLVGVQQLQLFQTNGSEIGVPTEASPVRVSNMTQCDEVFYCATFRAQPPENSFGRRLQALQASVSYQVQARGVTRPTQTVSVVIQPRPDPVQIILPSEPLEIRSDSVRQFLLQNATFADQDDGQGFLLLELNSPGLVFSADQDLQAYSSLYVDATKYFTSADRVHELLGYCPANCDTEAGSVRTSCTNCLSGSDVTGISRFSAVFAANITDTVKNSIFFAGVYGSVGNYTMNIRVNKFNQHLPAGVESSAVFQIQVVREPSFETYALEGYCYIWYWSNPYFEESLKCYLMWDGPVLYFWRGMGTSHLSIFGWLVVSATLLVIPFVIGVLCVCGFTIATARAGQEALTTMNKLRVYLEENERKERGERRKISFPAWVCKWATCGGCCFFGFLCTPGRVKDPTWRDNILGCFWNATCRLIPSLKPDHEDFEHDPRSWNDIFHELWTWICCRGCMLVPFMRSRSPVKAVPETPRLNVPGMSMKRAASPDRRDDLPLLSLNPEWMMQR